MLGREKVWELVAVLFLFNDGILEIFGVEVEAGDEEDKEEEEEVKNPACMSA